MAKTNNTILHNYLANLKLDVLLTVSGITTRSCEGDNIHTRSNRLYYITDGQCRFKINQAVIDTKRGSLLLIPAGSVLSFGDIYGRAFERYVCHFTADFGNYNLFEFFRFPYMIQYEEERQIKFIQMLFEDLVRSNDINDIPSAFKIQADIMNILACFVDKSARMQEGVRVNKEKSLHPVLLYIENHYQDDITVKELAEYAHLHPNYFIKSFKKQFGMPPIQYINRLRLTKARYALLNTNDTIQKIAVDSGFNGQSQFSKAFRQMYEVSPSEYRKTYIEKA